MWSFLVTERARARAETTIFVAIVAACLPLSPASAATAGKTYFFATREACVASGAFTRQDCVAAFVNSSAQLRDRAPRFASNGECRERFQLCELRRDLPLDGEASAYAEAESFAYIPLALGVEMVVTARGPEAAPTLAVETSARLFPKCPVSQPYSERETETRPATPEGRTAILPADRFEPFPKKAPMDARAAFSPFTLGSLQQSEPHGGGASEETPAERRARLRRAPFIE